MQCHSGVPRAFKLFHLRIQGFYLYTQVSMGMVRFL